MIGERSNVYLYREVGAVLGQLLEVAAVDREG